MSFAHSRAGNERQGAAYASAEASHRHPSPDKLIGPAQAETGLQAIIVEADRFKIDFMTGFGDRPPTKPLVHFVGEFSWIREGLMRCLQGCCWDSRPIVETVSLRDQPPKIALSCIELSTKWVNFR